MLKTLLTAGLLLGALALVMMSRAGEEKASQAMETPARQPTPGQEVITLGGGCFWCTEAVFDDLKGVLSVESGYAGGQVPHPTYKQVCTGETGHAEVVQVVYDPQVISLKQILQVFFTVHDPTTLNRQGADAGTQYRSVVLYRDEAQKKTAEEVIAEVGAEKIWPDPIVTTLEPFTEFYKAEAYHQEYFARNGDQPYCQVVIAPKVGKFRKHYTEMLKK